MGDGDVGLTCTRMATEAAGSMRLCREDASDGARPRAAEGSGGEAVCVEWG